MTAAAPPVPAQWTDEEIVARVRAGDARLFELLMRRYNQRIYRAVRSILRDEADTEDAMQAAYLSAYAHLREFAGRSTFSTWLTRIAIHEALARKRRGQRAEASEDAMATLRQESSNPEREVGGHELGRILGGAIDALPDHYRSVFVLRSLEELSVEETAACLDLESATVKTRLHRARALLRRTLLESIDMRTALPFEAPRCNRVVDAVLARILAQP
ncbi:MAG TPA: RNA polymerase sigma factor [Myxococcales bacterium]